ncbi:MAG TPA: ABC transporter permease [Chitinophagaceae bacterium]|nr:ABC transporter permease [Chitinophagaceae bacterium]
MKSFLAFVKKEFYHVLRDRRVLLILFGMPVVQVLLFGFALTSEVKNTRIAVVDYAKDNASREITDKVAASRYFDIDRNLLSHEALLDAFREGKVKAALVFPAGFERDLAHQGTAQVQIITDATDMNVAGQVTAYLTRIITAYQADRSVPSRNTYQITAETRMLYNPELRGAPNFVPGVMAMVLLLVCVMMTAVAIVKEKEMGTMEVLLVSPMKPALIIISKAVPYLILSLVDLIAILLLSVYVLKVPVRGSLALLMGESTLFIITCLMLGILISIQTASQEVAMLISLVAMMLPTLMLSGFMFPIENMPYVLQLLSDILPSKWYYIIVKMVMIKGAGFMAVWKETAILLGITLLLFGVSLKKFKIRLG